MSYDVDALAEAVRESEDRLDALKAQGSHAPSCRRPDVNFDPNCNLCVAHKNYVQAKADLAAGLAYREA